MKAKSQTKMFMITLIQRSFWVLPEDVSKLMANIHTFRIQVQDLCSWETLFCFSVAPECSHCFGILNRSAARGYSHVSSLTKVVAFGLIRWRRIPKKLNCGWTMKRFLDGISTLKQFLWTFIGWCVIVTSSSKSEFCRKDRNVSGASGHNCLSEKPWKKSNMDKSMWLR